MIERTRRVRLLSGDVREINRFDYNLAYCAWKGAGEDRYVQLTDNSWVRVGSLVRVEGVGS